MISWPSSQRAASISCETELLISIDEVKYGGEDTLRWRQCSMRGRPSRPESSSAFRAAYSASYRRMNPTWISLRPSRASASTTRSADAESGVSGFSQSTGRPRAHAASSASSCAPSGEATRTASTPGASSAARASPCTDTPGLPATAASARAVSGSATATTRAPPTVPPIRRMWSAPMWPAPSTATPSAPAIRRLPRSRGARAAAGPHSTIFFFASVRRDTVAARRRTAMTRPASTATEPATTIMSAGQSESSGSIRPLSPGP